MNRITRLQGAVIHNDRILLVKHHEDASGRDYWVIPGGGQEEGETESDVETDLGLGASDLK